LDHVPAHKVSTKPEDTGKYATRFRATPALLRLCTDHGVDPTKVVDHFEFEYDLPKQVLELRARKLEDFHSSTRPSGRPLEFERDGIVRAIEDNVWELNEYFDKQSLRGGSHHGYIRIFHNGDDEDFGWNKGGRLYSQHFVDSYQVMSAERRRRMTINGGPVAEIDISASYLTLFLSLHGIQLDTTKDPYELPGLGKEHRSAVKSWTVATFGSTRPTRRWPPRMRKKSPELSEYKVSKIKDAAFDKYPVLERWGTPLRGRIHGWADLMWMESAVMFGTMCDLMRKHDTPSLSVHDSLIVPASRAKVAVEAITKTCVAQWEVEPRLKINWPSAD
jgi:hypothetical protein